MSDAPRDPRLPAATYRIQLNKDFTFRHVLELVDYWHGLGITDLYVSPFLTARPGSRHGYDIVDPGAINPEVGTREELRLVHEALAARGMGLVIDVVPNHVCIATNDNPWWNDVLEAGPASPHARTFDIDWSPPKTELRDKVLLPVLGEQFGKALERGELRLATHDGALVVNYGERRFPINPATYGAVLEGVSARLRTHPSPAASAAGKLDELMTAVRELRARAGTAGEAGPEGQSHRQRIKRQLAELLAGSAPARAALEAELVELNGRLGQPRSFDRLERLLGEQAYRLSYWRVAGEEINYRRFFDINDLAAIRIEDAQVLEAVHARPFEWLERGWVTGLRVDHVDGLRDPRAYLDEVAARAGAPYLVVEKILGADERLPRVWATEGTTGYEFLNALNGLWIWRSGEKALRAVYDGLRTGSGSFADVVYESKRLVLQSSMGAELAVLARRLGRISEQHRFSRDFTLGTLTLALSDAIACFPVYRTYLTPTEEIAPQAMQQLRTAIAAARRRNPTMSGSVFEFLGDVLLGRDPEGLDGSQRAERRDFVARFQQLTGPVMAKGLEDTAFYRYFPLLSLNEVGGGPDKFGLSINELHRFLEERAREHPGGLSATATHDTKRGEDSRTRLDAISEIPEEWAAAVARWREILAGLKPRVDGVPAPDPDDEYYILQTLVGAWPTGGAADPGDPRNPGDPELATFLPRVQAAIEKALREAKRNTSWIDPQAPYEQATSELVARLLDPRGACFPVLGAFVERIRRPGLFTSLSQLVLKTTAPGVPDFFQGTELWDLGLVDPDNRRPVDYRARRRLLHELVRRAETDRTGLIAALRATPEDGRIKLWMSAALLRARLGERDLYARGAYLPLAVEGTRSENALAFSRRWGRRVAITAVARFFTQLPADPIGPCWSGTVLSFPAELPAGKLTDALTGRSVCVSDRGLDLGEVFAALPFAVLIGDAELGHGRSPP